MGEHEEQDGKLVVLAQNRQQFYELSDSYWNNFTTTKKYIQEKIGKTTIFSFDSHSSLTSGEAYLVNSSGKDYLVNYANGILNFHS